MNIVKFAVMQLYWVYYYWPKKICDSFLWQSTLAVDRDMRKSSSVAYMEYWDCQTTWKEPYSFQGNYVGHSQPQNEESKNAVSQLLGFSCIYKKMPSYKEFIEHTVERTGKHQIVTYIIGIWWLNWVVSFLKYTLKHFD